MEFTDKVVIVTGASKGIGKGIALLYSSKGAKVVLADIDELNGRIVKKEIWNQLGNRWGHDEKNDLF